MSTTGALATQAHPAKTVKTWRAGLARDVPAPVARRASGIEVSGVWWALRNDVMVGCLTPPGASHARGRRRWGRSDHPAGVAPSGSLHGFPPEVGLAGAPRRLSPAPIAWWPPTRHTGWRRSHRTVRSWKVSSRDSRAQRGPKPRRAQTLGSCLRDGPPKGPTRPSAVHARRSDPRRLPRVESQLGCCEGRRTPLALTQWVALAG